MNDWQLLQRAVEASRAETRAIQINKDGYDAGGGVIGFGGGADGAWNRPGASRTPSLLKNQTVVVPLRGGE